MVNLNTVMNQRKKTYLFVEVDKSLIAISIPDIMRNLFYLCFEIRRRPSP